MVDALGVPLLSFDGVRRGDLLLYRMRTDSAFGLRLIIGFDWDGRAIATSQRFPGTWLHLSCDARMYSLLARVEDADG